MSFDFDGQNFAGFFQSIGCLIGSVFDGKNFIIIPGAVMILGSHHEFLTLVIVRHELIDVSAGRVFTPLSKSSQS